MKSELKTLKSKYLYSTTYLWSLSILLEINCERIKEKDQMTYLFVVIALCYMRLNFNKK